jgi:hypothetical protein
MKFGYRDNKYFTFRTSPVLDGVCDTLQDCIKEVLESYADADTEYVLYVAVYRAKDECWVASGDPLLTLSFSDTFDAEIHL